MKRSEWIAIFAPLLIIWFLDRITKIWAESYLTTPLSFGWIEFTLLYNKGIMLGFFSQLPGYLRVVSLSTFGAVLVCIYVLVQILLPINTLKLRIGMSIVLGGIIGNVTDRTLWGHVVDFVVIGHGNVSTAVFNVADAVQWVGYGLVLFAIFREGDLIWPENNARKVYWVDRKFQFKYCAILMGVGLGISLVTMVFSYTYLRVTMIALIGLNSEVLDKYLMPFAAVFALISVGCSLGLFTVGKIISHRMVGPLFAFERHVLEMLRNLDRLKETKPLRFRSHDDFRHLENLATEIWGTLGKLKAGEKESTAPRPSDTDSEKS